MTRASTLASIPRPSLSFHVLDAVFSFWRLPLSTRFSLHSTVPKFHLESHGIVTLDWNLWLQYVDVKTRESGITAMDTTWALAMQAEHFVTNGPFKRPREASSHDVMWLTRLTHAKTVAKVAAMLEDKSGDFLMAFIVGVTILEKTLYDIDDERSRASAAITRRKTNVILRDLLHSHTLIEALPVGLLHLLKLLFLPSGLNLRNLVWHGFVAPAEFPKCFGCLTLLLLVIFSNFRDSTRKSLDGNENGEKRLFWIQSFDDKFVTKSKHALGEDEGREQEELVAVLRHETPRARAKLMKRWTRAPFIPAIRSNLLARAIKALVERGDDLWFLFAALPVLEHALRLEFLRANEKRAALSSAYGLAQVDSYYSTLDGFGQKHKHQVLLFYWIQRRVIPLAKNRAAVLASRLPMRSMSSFPLRH